MNSGDKNEIVKSDENNMTNNYINELTKQIEIISLDELKSLPQDKEKNPQIILIGQYLEYDEKQSSMKLMKLEYTEDNDENFIFQFKNVSSFIDQAITYLVSDKDSHLSLGIALTYLIHKGISYEEACKQYDKSSDLSKEYKDKLSQYDKYINMIKPDNYYKCNKCRTTLFDDADLMFLHEFTPKARYSYKRYKVSSVRTNECSSYFLKEMPVNGRLTIAENGNKILCTKCTNKIGEYHEIGSQCSCGSWVVPGIQIVKSKIDLIVNKN